jgi:hypothetical protein
VTRSRLIVGGAVIGLVAITIWLAIEGTSSIGSATIEGYQRTADDRKIVLVVTVLPLEEIAEREVHEDARTVTVKVHVRSAGSTPALGVHLPVAISLHAPLGSRTVLDGKGLQVPELIPYRLPGRPTQSP